MEPKIYNLSYDNSQKASKWSDEDYEVKREELLEYLITQGVIDYTNHFWMEKAPKGLKEPIVAYVVKTTMVFKSAKDAEEIQQIINDQYAEKLFYILTEVADTEEDYIARIHPDYELQQSCNEQIEDILKKYNTH